MEDQNIPRIIANHPMKIPSVIFRGMMWGTIGGVSAGLLFELLSWFNRYFFHPIHFPLPIYWDYLMNDLVGRIFYTVSTYGLPIGLVAGLSTGILAALFRHHCSNLLVWFVVSSVGVIISFKFGVSPFYGQDIDRYLLEIILIGLAASGAAYQATIRKIKKDVPKKGFPDYAFLCSLSQVILIFIMLGPYFFLSHMST